MKLEPKIILLINQDLDLYEYVRINILREDNSTFYEVFNFLKTFISLQNFPN
jgi:hypothetical protein